MMITRRDEALDKGVLFILFFFLLQNAIQCGYYIS